MNACQANNKASATTMPVISRFVSGPILFFFSSSVEQPGPQEVIQLGDRLDLLDRRIDVVRNADELDGRVRDHHKTAPRIAVPRLTYAPDVDDRLLVGQFELIVQ